MQDAETVLDVLRERGRRGLPLERLYRQLFNPQLYLLAYGRLYSNHGAMTPGVDGETVDGMSQIKIARIIDALRHERYRFTPVKRVYIPKKNGKMRPLGLPSWSDKLVGEVIRLLLEAYYEPQFSGRSHGFRPGRGCHTALSEVAVKWTGTTWFIEGDIARCFDELDHGLNGLIIRRPHTNTYDLTNDGLRFALFYTKVHDRVLTPLFAADQPQAPPELRATLHTLDHHIDQRLAPRQTPHRSIKLGSTVERLATKGR